MLRRLITVATFDDGVRAALAKNHLEAAGISAVLCDELTVTTGWALSGAIGGIKLQVAPLQAERAEHLLAELAAAREGDDVEFVTTGEAAQELAEERALEREEQSPGNQLADRALRAAALGLLLWPLQIYVWWLLLSLLTVPDPVSPGRRWKVWTAGLLSVPLVAVFFLLISLAPPQKRHQPAGGPGGPALLTPGRSGEKLP